MITRATPVLLVWAYNGCVHDFVKMISITLVV